MAILKAGTYRFNDVLSGDIGYLSQEIAFQFETSLTVSEDEAQEYNAFAQEVEGDWQEVTAGVYDLTCSCSWMGGTDTTAFGYQYDSVQCVPENNIIELFSAMNSSNGGSNTELYYGSWENEDAQTITIPTDQEVSTEFLTWFTDNAVEKKQISGKWKFKDELSVPSENMEQVVTFTTSPDYDETFAPVDGTILWNSIVVEGSDYPQVSYTGERGSYPVYNGYEGYGWNYLNLVVGANIFDERIKTIDFGTEPQIVSAEFYNWLTENANPIVEKDVYYSIKKDFLTNIANSIRAKTGKTDKMSVSQMSAEIDSITGGECEKVEEYNNIVIIEQGGGINGND